METLQTMLTRSDRLSFRDPDDRELLSGEHVVSVAGATDDWGGYAVTLQLDSEGAAIFEEATARLIGQTVSIWLDEELLVQPMVTTAISGGQIMITGSFTREEAEALASRISAKDTLPVKPIVVRSGVLKEGGFSAGNGLSRVRRVIIPNGFTGIGSYAFFGLTGLESVTIPPSVTVIGEHAFDTFDTVLGGYRPIPGLVVIAEKGSYAETYCTLHGISVQPAP